MVYRGIVDLHTSGNYLKSLKLRTGPSEFEIFAPATARPTFWYAENGEPTNAALHEKLAGQYGEHLGVQDSDLQTLITHVYRPKLREELRKSVGVV
jgi:hypothetical protein